MDDPWGHDRQLLNLWNAGIPFVTSAGNDGPGYGTVGAPANSPWVLAVGNSTHSRVTTERATVAGVENIPLVYGDGTRLSADVSGPVVADDESGGVDLGCGRYLGRSHVGAVVRL